MTPYPTTDKIEEIFSHRNVADNFNSYLSEHVDVSVAGREFHKAGLYKSKDAYQDAIFVPFASMLNMETIRIEVHQVIGGGDSAWAAVHLTGSGLCKSGKPFRHEFVDFVRFNSEGKIAQLKEFFDTKELQDHLDEYKASSSETKEK